MKAGAKISKLWLKVFLFTLLGVFIVRCFLIESYEVSSSDMETTLLKGDRVLVNKVAYGIRMPITPLTIPFTFDNFFGKKSYSTAIQLDYKRLFSSEVDRNDILLFNNPFEIDKPLDKRGLLLSRCVGIAGDTLRVENFEYSINGRKQISSPNLIQDFKYKKNEFGDLRLNLDKLGIKERNLHNDSLWIYVSLNRYEAFLLGKALKDTLFQVAENAPSYMVILPYEGMHVRLTAENIPIYKRVILDEQDGKVRFRDDKLYLQDQEMKFYTFRDNYYWLLSDNASEALDSRYLGFIPEKAIIGKASFVWYSSGEDGVRWKRIFSKIY